MNNIKIGFKLIGGFVLVALIAAGMTIYGIANIKMLDDRDTMLFEKGAAPFEHVVQLSTNFQRIRVNYRDLIMATDVEKKEYYSDRIDNLLDSLDKDIATYEGTLFTEKGKKLVADLKIKVGDFDANVAKFKGLVLSAKMIDAQALLTGDLAKASRAVQDQIVVVADAKLEATKALADENTVIANRVSATLIGILAVGVIFALAIGIFLTLSITGPLQKGVAMMLDMAKGHLGTRLNMSRKDEIGILATAMDDFSDDLQKNIVATVKKIGDGDLSTDLKPKDNQDEITPAIVNTTVALRGLIAEANMLSKAAVEGKLATRGAADKFLGGYKEIVQGVNNCLDAVINPLNVAAEYVDRISKGDIPKKITDNYNGDFNEIKNNLNGCIDAVNALVADAGKLSTAAVEGKLATRADATKHEGDFRKIVQGVNDCLDSVIGPLNVAAEYVDRISKGDIPAKISDSYNGDFNEIKNNLNRCIDAVNALVVDANMLSKAAVEGKLATRADASKHEGDFRKIVQGVDDCLDAVIGPLNVTAKYVDDISKGVIPPVITDNYNGDFNIIKNNLNAVVKMMSDLLKETDVIIRAAADGELDKRANASIFVGGWNQLVSGVNDTITNIVNPLMVTADYVDKVAKGVIPTEITTVYKGQYNIIKNNLNAVVKMMSDLLKESNTLVQAALGGALGTRAKAELFVGGWNELIAGINKTLDAVLEPINEAAGVLDKVAARDMTARVKGDYKGDHAKIKASLNSAVDNLDQALTQVAEATEQVSSGSQQISAGSQSLAQGANEQASSLEEVSSSLEEMASMTKQNAENANQANNLAAEANTNAATGVEAMERMNSSITKIKESSDQTAKIVKTIDEIAMQTNLLALNAAVEAARAGEAGRGFAVVAEEVRNLAQRSAQAAKSTADMIEESVKNAEEGVKISNEVSKSFGLIAGSSKKVNDLIAEIAAASQEQSTGIDQVNVAVSQMDKVTQQNAANSEESASAAEEMSSQAEELQSMIAQFNLTQSVQKRSGSSGIQKISQTQQAHPEVKRPQAATAGKNMNGKKSVRVNDLTKASKVLAESVIPMDEDLSQF